MSDQISAVADSLSLHIFMSVKKREVPALWVGEHWVEVTGQAFWRGGEGELAPSACSTNHPLPACCPQTRNPTPMSEWIIRYLLPPLHLPAISSASPSKMSSFRPGLPGCWELCLDSLPSPDRAPRWACGSHCFFSHDHSSWRTPCLLIHCRVRQAKHLFYLHDPRKGREKPNNPTEMTRA